LGFRSTCPFIEDQTFPKRCSYASGVQFVTRDAAVERVRAALKARDELRDAEAVGKPNRPPQR